MRKIISMIFKDLFWTYVPAIGIFIMAGVFASFFPDIWGRLTFVWIVITLIFVWKVN